jgi:TnpA family transposase
MIDGDVEELLEPRTPRSIGLQHERKEVISSLLRDISISTVLFLLHYVSRTKVSRRLIDGQSRVDRLGD